MSDSAFTPKPKYGERRLASVTTTESAILTHPENVRDTPHNLSSGQHRVTYLHTVSQSELPCTIPDSQARSHSIHTFPGRHQQCSQADSKEKKMSQKSVATNDTEPISQSVIDEMIARSNQDKTAHQSENRVIPNAEIPEVTKLEKRTGQIDLLSSFQLEAAPDRAEDDEDGVTDSSPLQTQAQLSQYPELERFGPPSTRGKKRDYRGNTIESPQLPHNPLAGQRSSVSLPKDLGLTQVFQATQAQTSPFANGVTSEPRSDRPSPYVNIQARPAQGCSSSPLLRREDPRRNATDPHTNYTTIEESQAYKTKFPTQEAEEDEVSEDDFDEPSSWVKQQKFAEKRREKRAKSFQALSSPLRKSKSPPATSPSSRKHFISSSPSQEGGRQEILGRDTIQVIPDEDIRMDNQNGIHSQNFSEVETDQEGNTPTLVKKAATRRLQRDEEDKENIDLDVIRVPDTTRRLQQVLSDGPSEVSPSMGKAVFSQTQTIITSPIANGLPAAASSQRIAVEDSQRSPKLRKASVPDQHPIESPVTENAVIYLPAQLPPNGTHVSASPTRSQSILQATNVAMPMDGTKSEERGIGTQVQKDAFSQKRSNLINDPSARNSVGAAKPKDPQQGKTAVPGTNVATHSHEIEENMNNSIHLSRTGRSHPGQKQLQSTPETSSSQVLQSSMDVTAPPREPPSSSKKVPDPSSKSENIPQRDSSTYETANTHLPQYVSAPAPTPHLIRIPSMLESPNGGKRKRMLAITGQKSPQKAIEDTDFDVRDLLSEDGEFQAVLKGSSPIRPRRNGKRRRLNKDPETVPEINENKTLAAGYKNRESRGPPSDPIFDFDPQLSPSPKTPQSARSSRLKTYTATKSLSRPKQRLVERMTTSGDHTSPSTVTRQVASVSARPITESAIQNDPAPSRDLDSLDEARPDEREVTAPNQVFARYSGNTRGYYPARCLRSIPGEHFRYEIQWEGYDPDEIDAQGVRRLELRIGDTVKIDNKGFPKVSHIVRGFKDAIDKNQSSTKGPITDIFGNRTLIVAPKQRKSLPLGLGVEQCREVAISNIYLDSTMWNQIKGRDFELKQGNPPQQGLATPPERPSTPSTPASRSRRSYLAIDASFSNKNGLFVDMAFAISYGDERRKRSITDIIIQNGGRVLENGFQDLFDSHALSSTSASEQLQRKLSNPPKFTLHPNASRLRFAALIADRHSRKPKYMQALALNLPCLNGKWLEECVTRGSLVDWQTCLLPSGESAFLEGATKSRFLASYDPSKSSLSAILKGRPRLFSGQSVTFVKPKGKKDGRRDERHDDFIFLARAMGAAEIFTVADSAVTKSLAGRRDERENFDWIITYDSDRKLLGKPGGNAGSSSMSDKIRSKIVSFDFIIQSLILGILLED